MKTYIIGAPNENRFELSLYCVLNNLTYHSVDNSPFPKSALYSIQADQNDLTAMKLSLPFNIKILEN